MNKRLENTDSFRRCRICKETKPLDNVYFYNEKGRPYGLSYVCKPCEIIRGKEKAIKHPRKYLRKFLTEDQRQARLESNRRYGKKALSMVKQYTYIDKRKGYVCDLTPEFLIEKILEKPCFYCGDTESKTGCERLDNSKGHIMSNVVPCCRLCNVTRMDNYSVQEMVLLGTVIEEIRMNRKRISTFYV